MDASCTARWLARQRLDDPLAQEALEQLLIHLDGIERQLATLDARLSRDRRQRTVGRTGADPDEVPWDRDHHRARVDRRDRRLRPLLASARAGRVARDHPERVLLRRSAAPRAHHPVGEPSRPPAADRGRVALPPRAQGSLPAACRRTSAPGKPRSGCITDTGTSPTTGNARPSRTSRSPASSPGSCGPR